MKSEEFLSYQTRAVLTFNFLSKYFMLEEAIKNIFRDSIGSLEQKHHYKIYYMYGGLKAAKAMHFDNELDDFKTHLEYNYKDQFGSFSSSQIIRLCKEGNLIPRFSFEIDSIQSKTSYVFYHCFSTLTKMRNIIAHECDNSKFRDNVVIELLSDQNIEKYRSEDINISTMDVASKQIQSNLIYLELILKKFNNIE